jgi:hypothetical protein
MFLCASFLAYVVSAAAVRSAVKPWVILLSSVATLLLPVLVPLPSEAYQLTTVAVAAVLSGGVLGLPSQPSLGDAVAAVVLVALLLTAPVPLALHDRLVLQHDDVLDSIERDMHAQEVLLHRVIPSVFVDALLCDRKTTSPPLPDISVMFVEVMVQTAGGREPPRKLGSNIQGDTLDILSHVFKLLDRVVSRNGGASLRARARVGGWARRTLCPRSPIRSVQG